MTAQLDELLRDRAALYVSGSLNETERESFEVILESNPELKDEVASLQEAASQVIVSRLGAGSPAPAALKARILASVADRPQQRERDALVITRADGTVQWVNEAFTAMCGYTLEELQGTKPGRLLQGPKTDPDSVECIRQSLRSRQPCRVQMVNYHKDGSTYLADIRISPFLDDDHQPVWFVARERKIAAAVR